MSLRQMKASPELIKEAIQANYRNIEGVSKAEASIVGTMRKTLLNQNQEITKRLLKLLKEQEHAKHI